MRIYLTYSQDFFFQTQISKYKILPPFLERGANEYRGSQKASNIWYTSMTLILKIVPNRPLFLGNFFQFFRIWLHQKMNPALASIIFTSPLPLLKFFSTNLRITSSICSRAHFILGRPSRGWGGENFIFLDLFIFIESERHLFNIYRKDSTVTTFIHADSFCPLPQVRYSPDLEIFRSLLDETCMPVLIQKEIMNLLELCFAS